MSTATTVSDAVREYEKKVEKLRAYPYGTVREESFRPHDCDPYRYCQLEVDTSRSIAPSLVRQLAELSIAVGGHLTMHVYTHIEDCRIQIGVSRPLEAGE